MAVKTWTELHEYVQAHFIENYDEDITAEHLRVLLIDLLDTLSAVISTGISEVRRGSVDVTTAGTQITFINAFEDLDYIVIGHVVSGKAIVRHEEYDFTVNGFKVKPVVNGKYTYIAVPV